MTEHKEACCTSPAAVCYWFTVSLVAWGVLSLIGVFWRPFHALAAATTLFAMAIGCVANWLRNRTLHCAITGPLFLIAALVFLLLDVTSTHLNSLLVGPFVAIGVGIAFLLEWRYTRLYGSQH
jgi:hypothetical protein